MRAGVPLVQSFDIVYDGVDNQSLKELVLQIRTDVAAGGGFAPALRKHPRYFDDLFCLCLMTYNFWVKSCYIKFNIIYMIYFTHTIWNNQTNLKKKTKNVQKLKFQKNLVKIS